METANTQKPLCQCCGKKEAVSIDVRERYANLNYFSVCLTCLDYNNLTFWRVYNANQKKKQQVTP